MNPTPDHEPNQMPRTALKQPGPLLWVGVVLAGLGALGIFAYLAHHKPVAVPPTQQPVATDHPAPGTQVAPAMPSEEMADTQVRRAAAGLSGSPTWAEWLKEDSLARKLVATINAVAEGLNPRAMLSFLAPTERFRAEHRHGRELIDPRSYDRFNGVADVIDGIDAGKAAHVWADMHPLLTAAYAEIGQPGTSLDDRLAEAIRRLDAVQIPRESVAVVPSGLVYKFADKELESLPAPSKALLRMGPRNMKIIQAKLREIATELHLSPLAQRDAR